MERCGWVSQDQLYIDYHDREWGVPETDGKNSLR
jgi:DNA-3-methyladenine glycosylase I